MKNTQIVLIVLIVIILVSVYFCLNQNNNQIEGFETTPTSTPMVETSVTNPLGSVPTGPPNTTAPSDMYEPNTTVAPSDMYEPSSTEAPTDTYEPVSDDEPEPTALPIEEQDDEPVDSGDQLVDKVMNRPTVPGIAGLTDLANNDNGKINTKINIYNPTVNFNGAKTSGYYKNMTSDYLDDYENTKDPIDSKPMASDEMEKLVAKRNDKLRKDLKKRKGGRSYGDDMHPAKFNQKSYWKHQKFYRPGYQFVNPKSWSVPQERPPVCIPQKKVLPSAVYDRGLSLNYLELDNKGKIATSEDKVTDTNVGSILPKFSYEEYYDY